MSETITCGCGEVFSPEGEPGTEVRCPRCFQSMRIPPRDVAQTLGYRGLGGSSGLVTQRAVDLLGQTSIWVRIMSILMFVGAGLMVLGGGVIFAVGMMGRGGPGELPAFVGCIYIPFGLLYIVPGLFLWRYATYSKAYAIQRHESHLEGALQAQKSFWKFVAILALVMIGLYLLMIPIVIIGAIAAHR
jgi:hypothetical protein